MSSCETVVKSGSGSWFVDLPSCFVEVTVSTNLWFIAIVLQIATVPTAAAKTLPRTPCLRALPPLATALSAQAIASRTNASAKLPVAAYRCSL
ncbi:hypothetical protein FS837_001395 [Tulasnella sp. UAMH 9824]|nr:hypothetical protein FS837_001395 [Tulasnella sp. UAMH 9824]